MDRPDNSPCYTALETVLGRNLHNLYPTLLDNHIQHHVG